MPRLTPQQRLFCYKLKVRGKKYSEIVAEFALQYPAVPVPHRNTIYGLFLRMEEHCSLNDRNSNNSGPPVSSRTDDNVLRVYGSYLDDPRLSIRQRSVQLGIPRSTLQEILRLDLTLYPYLITRRHELKTTDFPIRVRFAYWFLQEMNNDPDFVNNIWWSDESHIHLNGYVNTHNTIHWGSERPTDVVPVRRYPEKITVWCAISAQGILGPYFYEENNRTVTVTGARYHRMLRFNYTQDLLTLCTQTGADPQKQWFMQDGARPHITALVRIFLTDPARFGTRTIGDRLAHHWPARSPDITPCDFFLWGYVKDQIRHLGILPNRDALKAAVTNVIRGLDQQICTRACHSVVKRLQVLRIRGGRHIEQVLR